MAYGFGKNLSSNTFEALLADKFTGEQRPRAVTFFKVAMFVGIMLGAMLPGTPAGPLLRAALADDRDRCCCVASFILAHDRRCIWQEPRREAAIHSESQKHAGNCPSGPPLRRWSGLTRIFDGFSSS
jgi:hypothetical protein